MLREHLHTFQQNLRAQLARKENIQNVVLVIAALTSGLISVLYAKLFKFAEGLLPKTIGEHKELIFIATPALFLMAWWITYRFSQESTGSGIPQVLVANTLNDDAAEKKHIQRFLSFRVIITKTISSIICVIGGGAIGREGPTLQISASVFYLFGKRVKKYIPDSKSHLWIISGAAAGLAAAFNTPLGGIIYAIEELGGAHFSRIRTNLLAAIITSGLVSLWLSGNYLYLGFPKISIEGISIIPIAIALAIVTGLAGGIFSSLLFSLSSKRRKIKSKLQLGLITALCGLIMACLIYFNEKSAGSGLGLLNEYLFQNKEADISLVLSRFFGTILSYLAGSAGGIFSPSLAIGGSIGSYFSHLFDSADQNILVLLGMIGFLTGVTKTPFTSFILVVEMTNKHSAILPMMVTALVALLASNLINHHSFYERVKGLYELEIASERGKVMARGK